MAVPTAAVVEVDSNLSSKVELYISCRELKNMDLLSKSDPFVVVSGRESRAEPWRELMRTKTVWDNLNPDFTEPVKIVYHFERVQELKFDVYDRDNDSDALSAHDFIGTCATTLSKIMGSRGAVFSDDLEHMGSKHGRGRIVLRGEEVSSCEDVAHLRFAALKLDRKDWFGFGKSDPFLTISRSREDGGWVKVWESETIMKELNPIWNPADVPVQVLCNGDLDRPLKLAVFDWNANGSHSLIGETIVSLNQLNGVGEKSMRLDHPEIKQKKGHKYQGSGTLKALSITIEKRFSFLEYIRGGCDLNLIVAIDFTASNGAYSTPSSLHHQHPSALAPGSQRNFALLNEYQKAILSVGEILQDYDSDGRIPVLGFGGAVNGSVNHCFPLTFDPERPEVVGVEGIMEVYANAFNFVSLSGPTLFSKVLATANNYARQQCTQLNQNYTVLLLLTDGVLNDMDQSVEQIIEGSELPLSIVIVGVGNANFDNMETLDADDTPLTYRGKTMKRDIVQFVPFRKFLNQHYSALAAEVLAEIPGQLVEYMSSKGIRPNPPTLASQRHLAIERSQRHLNGGQLPAPAPSADGALGQSFRGGLTAMGSAATMNETSVPFAVPVPSTNSSAPSAPPAPLDARGSVRHEF